VKPSAVLSNESPNGHDSMERVCKNLCGLVCKGIEFREPTKRQRIRKVHRGHVAESRSFAPLRLRKSCFSWQRRCNTVFEAQCQSLVNWVRTKKSQPLTVSGPRSSKQPKQRSPQALVQQVCGNLHKLHAVMDIGIGIEFPAELVRQERPPLIRSKSKRHIHSR
jgi:hypothetical protein